jgi:hypothetical protein
MVDVKSKKDLDITWVEKERWLSFKYFFSFQY